MPITKEYECLDAASFCMFHLNLCYKLKLASIPIPHLMQKSLIL